jgi:D-glucosaminate-6-phosphate ammonia-lyase
MRIRTKQSLAGLSRRDIFRHGSVAAGMAAGAPLSAAPSRITGPDPYTKIGVRPFINTTATLTINGGSQMLPEVIATIEQASHYHVNLDELMEKVGDQLAKLLQVEWGIVTAGAASAATHATAGCIAGTDPEKMQRLPNLEGLKNEVIMPRESRNVYDHATRTLGVKIIEVNSVDELQSALSRRTAMVQVLGSHFGHAKFGLKEVAPIARKAGVPIFIDAAADYLIVPNPYIALGADMVAYSGGKIIRGPQTAGLLVGRKDLIRAAWANSAPHHAFGRAAKVSKEEIVGMLAAVEAWRTRLDVQTQFREWESWYAHINEQLTKIPGVRTQVRGPARGGPFPTLEVDWDPNKIGLTAGDVGRMLLDGEPRIMSHAQGEGYSFVIRPAAMKEDEYKLVAQRLYEIFRNPPKPRSKPAAAAPAVDVAGRWDVEVQYEVGSAQHKLFLTSKGNQIGGSHVGWAFEGDINGRIDGDLVEIRSVLPAGGQRLNYNFTGTVSGDAMSGDVDLGEYGRARWTARRHNAGAVTSPA